MQHQPKTHSLFLEDWLRSAGSAASSAAGAASITTNATAIVQSWSDLRSPSILSSPNRLLSSLQTLAASSLSSLHVADPQAKLLLSLLSSGDSPLPSPALPLIARLLSVWLRKNPNPNTSLIQSLAVPAVLSLLASTASPFSLLLLGILSASPNVPHSSKNYCLDLLCSLLDREIENLCSDEDLMPEILSGIGYALSRSDDAHFGRILGSLFGIWGGSKDNARLDHGLMILQLFEWVVSGFIGIKNLSRIEFLCREVEVLERKCAKFAVLMAACGILRAFRLNSWRNVLHLRNSMERIIGSVAEYAVSGVGNEMEKRLVVQCVLLGLVRCGMIGFSPSVFLCVCTGLLNEIFPLRALFKMAVQNSSSDVLDKVKQHLGSVLFKEAGAATGVFCNQYAMADEERKVVAENYMWDYSHHLYFDLRKVVLLLKGKNDELIGKLDKIAEAAFLMVVVFAAEVAKYKLNSKLPYKFRPEAAVKILVAFSCIEYLRRVRLLEYTEAVRRAVLTIQENVDACALFVESLPPYAELTNQNGSLALEGMRYVWWEDEVQTARMLFCLRVIPTCISLVTASMFGKIVTPTMFLYMRHPNEKVARASHSVFVAFMSSGKDSEQEDRSALKEQLVFYYMQRSLEAYPGITPFEGLASGVAALVRHLPAGSPAIFYCVHSLVGKATELCSRASSEDATIWKSWEGSSEPCKKVVDLLLRLIALVDIQVLPYLLKQLAEFVARLHKQGQNVLLNEMYTQVAESDDVTRKPVLVSWLQSLSYLCSQKRTSVKKGDDVTEGSLGLNGASARL